ncbi:unnamed protein product [Ectocarpus sp. 12 AP-2014]
MTTSNDVLIAKNAMSGQASPTAEDMSASEPHQNSDSWTQTAPATTVHRTSVAGVRPGIGVFQPVHNISRDDITDAHEGIYLPLLPPKAPAPFVAMEPEATAQLF